MRRLIVWAVFLAAGACATPQAATSGPAATATDDGAKPAAENFWDFDPSQPVAQVDYWIGKQAPDFTLADLDGKQVSLASLKGSEVVLTFGEVG